MALKTLTKQEKIELEQVRILKKIIEKSGIQVRRENLTRGNSYRVKSGICMHDNTQLFFVDKRLPFAQQISMLTDLIIDYSIHIDADDLENLNPQTSSILLVKLNQEQTIEAAS